MLGFVKRTAQLKVIKLERRKIEDITVVDARQMPSGEVMLTDTPKRVYEWLTGEGLRPLFVDNLWVGGSNA